MSGTTMKRTLTRRTALQMSAVATLAPALGPILPAPAQQPPPPQAAPPAQGRPEGKGRGRDKGKDKD